MASTKGCRLRATDRHIIKIKGDNGVTGGYVDPASVTARANRRPSAATIRENKAKQRRRERAARRKAQR